MQDTATVAGAVDVGADVAPAMEPSDKAEILEPGVERGLPSSSARLAEVLRARDDQKKSGALGSKAKAKAVPKKALKRPGSKMDGPTIEQSNQGSKAAAWKRPASKSAAATAMKKKNNNKKSDARKPKMTRTCVYSRAYHAAQCSLSSFKFFFRFLGTTGVSCCTCAYLPVEQGLKFAKF